LSIAVTIVCPSHGISSAVKSWLKHKCRKGTQAFINHIGRAFRLDVAKCFAQLHESGAKAQRWDLSHFLTVEAAA
jgi:hypothetical protein